VSDEETIDWVRGQLIEVLLDIQRQGGRQEVALTGHSIPFDVLPGFDSINGVEAEVLLSKRLGIDLKHLPFVDAEDRQLTVEEIAAAAARDSGLLDAHAPKARPRLSGTTA